MWYDWKCKHCGEVFDRMYGEFKDVPKSENCPKCDHGSQRLMSLPHMVTDDVRNRIAKFKRNDFNE